MAETFDRLVNNAEAAEMLSVSARNLVAMRERGELPFIRLADHSRGYRYSAKALTDWIADHQRINTSPAK